MVLVSRMGPHDRTGAAASAPHAIGSRPAQPCTAPPHLAQQPSSPMTPRSRGRATPIPIHAAQVHTSPCSPCMQQLPAQHHAAQVYIHLPYAAPRSRCRCSTTQHHAAEAAQVLLTSSAPPRHSPLLAAQVYTHLSLQPRYTHHTIHTTPYTPHHTPHTAPQHAAVYRRTSHPAL